MVDVDRRMASLSPSPVAHAAALRRLSARAGAGNTTSASAWTSHRGGLLSYRPMAESITAHLRAASVPLLPGLSDAELAGLEADFAFSFPPDLRALLALALPSSPGFPDWRSHLDRRRSGDDIHRQHDLLRLSFDLPIAAASLQVARRVLWPRSWGSRPADPQRALRQARAALWRAPVLVPIFGRCYIPSSPSLAGNPVFFVDEDQIVCCGIDLADFFLRHPAFRPPTPVSLHHHQEKQPPSTPCIWQSVDAAVSSRVPRWIELWSDAASDRRRRNSSSSSSSSSCSSSETASSPPSPALDPTQFSKSRTAPRQPEWLELYLDRIGSVLKQGGWAASEVDEMVRYSASDVFDFGDDETRAGAGPGALPTVFIDSEAAVDSLLITADWCSDSLRRAGWSSEEVSDTLLVDLVRRRRRERRTPVELPSDVALKFEKLAKAVARS